MVIRHIGPARETNLNGVDYEVGKIMDASDLITDGRNLFLSFSPSLRSCVCSVNSGDISGISAVAQLCTYWRALQIKLGKLISLACAPSPLVPFFNWHYKTASVFIIHERDQTGIWSFLLLCTLTQVVAYVCARTLNSSPCSVICWIAFNANVC